VPSVAVAVAALVGDPLGGVFAFGVVRIGFDRGGADCDAADDAPDDDRFGDGARGGTEIFAEVAVCVVVVGQAIPCGVLRDHRDTAQRPLLPTGNGDQFARLVAGKA